VPVARPARPGSADPRGLRLALAVALGLIVLLWAVPSAVGPAPGSPSPGPGGVTALEPGLTSAARSAPSRTPAVPEDDRPGGPVRGRLVVDDWGDGQDVLAGEIVVRVGPEGARRALRVVDGAWSWPLDAPVRATVETVRLGWIEVEPRERELVAAPGAEVELHARLGAVAWLHVRSAASRGELDEVRLAFDPGWDRGHLRHPGPHPTPLAGGLRSPIPLPLDAVPHAFWARAPGHAWGRVVLAPPAEHAVELLLPPEGALTVRFPRGPAPRGSVVRLRRVDLGRDPFAEAPAGGATTVTLEGLAPGTYRVSCEPARPDGAAARAAQEVTVAPGGRALVELELDGTPPRTGTLVGSLRFHEPPEALDWWIRVVPEATEGGRSAGRITPADLRPLDAAGLAFAWEPLALPAGLHRIEVQPFQVRRTVRIEPGGSTVCALEVPPVRLVSVRVLDARGGLATVEGASFRWSPLEGDDCPSCIGTFLAGENPVCFRAPEGFVAFEAQGAGWSVAEPELAVGGDANEFTLLALPSSSVEIELVDARGAPRPVDLAWWEGLGLEALDGPGQALRLDFGAREPSLFRAQGTLVLSHPGAYRVGHPPWDGLHLASPARIEVAPGTPARVVLELREE